LETLWVSGCGFCLVSIGEIRQWNLLDYKEFGDSFRSDKRKACEFSLAAVIPIETKRPCGSAGCIEYGTLSRIRKRKHFFKNM
jgi:hypothetical protein